MKKKYRYDPLEEHLKKIEEALKIEMLKKFTEENLSIEEVEKSLMHCDISSKTRAEIVVFVLEHSKR